MKFLRNTFIICSVVLTHLEGIAQQYNSSWQYVDDSPNYIVFYSNHAHFLTDSDTNFLFMLDEKYKYFSIDEWYGFIEIRHGIWPHHGGSYFLRGLYKKDGTKILASTNYSFELIHDNLILGQDKELGWFTSDTLGNVKTIPYNVLLWNSLLERYAVCVNCTLDETNEASIIISDSCKVAYLFDYGLLTPIHSKRNVKLTLKYGAAIHGRRGEFMARTRLIGRNKTKLSRQKKRLEKALLKTQKVSFEAFNK